MNSFVDEACYGTCFLNVLEDEPSSVSFVEDIVHQAGHLVLSAAAVQPGRLLAVDPASGLREITLQPTEHRTVLAALHGFFTEVMIAQALDACLREGTHGGPDAFECSGRLAFTLHKLLRDSRVLNVRRLFTPEGARFFAWLTNIFVDIFARREDSVRSLDMSGQTYNFSRRIFFERNRRRSNTAC
ncbi:MAG: hypothetical protein WDN03_11905 [Rhizomicrobium sp.]